MTNLISLLDSTGAEGIVPFPDDQSRDVLLIDDDPLIRDSLLNVLRKASYSVCAARSGSEAAPLLSAHRFRLVITDVFMPEMDGYEVIRTLVRANPKQRILAMSGGGNGRWAALGPARLMGASDVLSKPFDLVEFLTVVRRLLN